MRPQPRRGQSGRRSSPADAVRRDVGGRRPILVRKSPLPRRTGPSDEDEELRAPDRAPRRTDVGSTLSSSFAHESLRPAGYLTDWIAASTANFMTPQSERKRTSPPVNGSVGSRYAGAGVRADPGLLRVHCAETRRNEGTAVEWGAAASFISPEPCAARTRAVRRRARSRLKLSVTKTNLPRVVITTGPSSVVNTFSSVPSFDEC